MTFSDGAQLAGPGSGKPAGGQDAAKIAPGTIVAILGDNLSEEIVAAPKRRIPCQPALAAWRSIRRNSGAADYVSPTEIRAQMPWEVNDAYSVNAYVRIRGRAGAVRTTTAIAVPMIPQNPAFSQKSRAEWIHDPR